MPERVLVAYATHTGSTAEVATAIGEELRARGLNVDVAPVTAEDPFAATRPSYLVAR